MKKKITKWLNTFPWREQVKCLVGRTATDRRASNHQGSFSFFCIHVKRWKESTNADLKVERMTEREDFLQLRKLEIWESNLKKDNRLLKQF